VFGTILTGLLPFNEIQVGVQCEVDAEAGHSYLEDKVNQILPLQDKEEEEQGDGSK
jgi:hypothetical protein